MMAQLKYSVVLLVAALRLVAGQDLASLPACGVSLPVSNYPCTTLLAIHVDAMAYTIRQLFILGQGHVCVELYCDGTDSGSIAQFEVALTSQ